MDLRAGSCSGDDSVCADAEPDVPIADFRVYIYPIGRVEFSVGKGFHFVGAKSADEKSFPDGEVRI